MDLTISVFYYCYLILLALFLLFSFFNYYHLIKFGFASWGNWAIMIFYTFITLAILSITWNYLQTIDWQTPLASWENFSWKEFLQLKLNTNSTPPNANIIQY